MTIAGDSRHGGVQVSEGLAFNQKDFGKEGPRLVICSVDWKNVSFRGGPSEAF